MNTFYLRNQLIIMKRNERIAFATFMRSLRYDSRQIGREARFNTSQRTAKGSYY